MKASMQSVIAIHINDSLNHDSNDYASINKHDSDYKDDGNNVLLDANENAYGPSLVLNDQADNVQTNGHTDGEINFSGLNRYPDP